MTKESLAAAVVAHPVGAERLFPPRLTNNDNLLRGTVTGHRDTGKGPFVEIRMPSGNVASVRPGRLSPVIA